MLSNLVRSHSFTAAVKRMVPRVPRAEESADDLSVDAPQSFSAEGPRARAREGLSVDATHAPGDPRSVQQAWLEQAEMREPPVAIGVDELRTLIAVSKEAAEYRKCAHDLQQALAASQAALHERELELSAARANRRRSEAKADAIASAQAAASAAIAAAAHAHRLEMQRFRQDMLAAVAEAQSTWASTWQREKEWAETFLGESMRRTLRETMQEYRVPVSPSRESASLVLLPPSSSSCTGVAAVPIVEEAELQRGPSLHGHGQLAMDLAAAIAKRRFLIGHHGQDESSDEEEGWVPERERERGRGKREPGEGEGHRRRPVSPPDNAASHGTSEPSRDSAGLASSPGDGTAALSETVPVEADVVLRSAAPLTAPLHVGAPSAILRLGALPSRAPPPSGRRGRTAVGALHKPSVRDCLNERSHLQKAPHGLPDGLNKNSPKMGDESEPNWGECLNVPSPEALSPQSTISMLDGPSHSFGLIATHSPFLARVLRSPDAERRLSATNSSAAAERVSIVWPSLRSAWRSAQAMAAGRRRFGLRKSAILVVIAAMLVALSPIAMLKAERRPGFADTELWPQMRLAPLPKLPSGWALTDLPAGFGFFPTSTPCKPSPQPRRRAVHGRALRSWWGVPALV
eukprot:jgi/Chrpa1/27463/Chrysochromulina_OHIO_Genome00009618-RA